MNSVLWEYISERRERECECYYGFKIRENIENNQIIKSLSTWRIQIIHSNIW